MSDGKSVLSKGERSLGCWSCRRGILQERSCGLAGALLSHPVEKSSVYKDFLCGGPLLCGGAREAAGDQENEVSGQTFTERKIEGVYRDGGFGNHLVEPVTGKPVSIIAAADAKRVWERGRQASDDPYRAVGTKSGMLPGILFDRMEIWTEKTGSVGLTDRSWLSRGTAVFRKDFTMILPESLFTDKI